MSSEYHKASLIFFLKAYLNVGADRVPLVQVLDTLYCLRLSLFKTGWHI